MGGSNPYISKSAALPPQQPYEIHVIDLEHGGTRHDIQVDPRRIPYYHNGLPGSLLDILLGNDIDINHSCGGVCACSTCHVIIRKGAESCPAATDDELDELDQAPNLTPQSRLACQCVPNGSARIELEIPKWNRNAVRE